MDNLKSITKDRTGGDLFEECVDHPTCQILDVDSIYACNPSSTNRFDVAPSTKEEIMATGYPSTENIFVGHGFVGSMNSEKGVANWVFECLTPKQINAMQERSYPRGEFYIDRKIYFEKIVSSMDYEGTVYERGHLAAAANHKYNSLAYYNTFWFGNTAPMHKEVNLILGKIEKQGRRLARDFKRLYIITGSHFKSKFKPMKAGSQVGVPNAFFKVLIGDYFNAHKKKKQYKVFGYMVDNKTGKERIKDVHKDIKLAKKSLSSIKHLTGLNIISVKNGREIVDYHSTKMPNTRQRTGRENGREIVDDLLPEVPETRQRVRRGIGG